MLSAQWCPLDSAVTPVGVPLASVKSAHGSYGAETRRQPVTLALLVWTRAYRSPRLVIASGVGLSSAWWTSPWALRLATCAPSVFPQNPKDLGELAERQGPQKGPVAPALGKQNGQRLGARHLGGKAAAPGSRA